MTSIEQIQQDTNGYISEPPSGLERVTEQVKKIFLLLFDESGQFYTETAVFAHLRCKEVYRGKDKDRFLQFAYDTEGRELTDSDGTLDAPRPGVQKVFRKGQSLWTRSQALLFGFDTFLMIESVKMQAQCVQMQMCLRELQQRCQEELAPLASPVPPAPDTNGENQEAAEDLSHLLTTKYGPPSQITPKACMIHDGKECPVCEDLQNRSFSFPPLPSVLGDVDDEAGNEKRGGSEDDETDDEKIGGTEDGKIDEIEDDKGDGMEDDEGDGKTDDKKQANDKRKRKNKPNKRKSRAKRNRQKKK
ncbi:hypothetical protein EKO27_g10409 [Xylaria grammica]|uniref:Uncharacterized protein n=1 Tax=Xylaria grammica TaxID=363999 RepID=A0A439CRB8_9PEZI|nr:hypothetical protein EKO27_g10409 [Xylaria grammica]